jgi:hypothetical protein
MAGCGQGKDGAALDDVERAVHRGQALTWLCTDLTAIRSKYEKEPAKNGPKIMVQMRHWQRDAEFNGVRGEKALAMLPEAERQKWRRFWDEVEDLTKQASPLGPFVQDWLVLSELVPYVGDDGARALDEQQIPGEAFLRPLAGEQVEITGKTLLWKEHRSADPYIDFAALYGSPSEYRVAYAVCYVHSNGDRADLLLRVGSDDQAKLYLNGKEIYRQPKGRSLEIDQDEIRPVELRKGSNVLVFKVVNQISYGPEGSVRFVTKDGAAPEGIEYRLAP